MASGANIFVASALAAAGKAGWQQYQQWKLRSVPAERRGAYMEQQRTRGASVWFRLPYYLLGAIIATGLVAAVVSLFF